MARQHHAVQHTCTVKGTNAETRKRVSITVQGRAAQVRARIETRINAGAQRLDFTDVTTGRTVWISLASGDLVAVS